MLRKISFFNSYIEGWALYAEQLSDEIGGYDGHREGRLPAVLPVPLRAPGRRHRPQRQGLEPREGGRLHDRDHRLPAAARPARGRALLLLDRPGVQLQGRPPRLAPRPRGREEDARRQVRHPPVPRSAEGRRDAAVDPRAAHEGACPRAARGCGGDDRNWCSPNAARSEDQRDVRSRLALKASAISATSSQRTSAASMSARWRAMRSVSSAKRSGSRA